MVPSGLRQRISTSAPRSRPERMSTIGWKYGTNSPALSARSISSIGLSRSRLGSSTEIARMTIARSPLAIVPNARRSPWLAASPSGDADMIAWSAIAAGGQIGDDDHRRGRRPASLARLGDHRAAGGQHPGMEAHRPAAGRNLRHEQRGRNERRNAVARTRCRDGGCEATAPGVRRAAPVPADCGCPADSGSDETTLRCSGWLPTSVHSVRPSGATIESSLTGMVAESRLAQRVHVGDAAGIDAARREIVERRHRARDASLGQRHVAPGRQVELFPALPLDQAAQPNIQRRHRRSCQDHADADRCEQLASRRHLNPHTQLPVQVERAALRRD